MTNADDYETILNEANYYVTIDKLKRQIQQLNGAESRTEIKVIGGLLNYTFFDMIVDGMIQHGQECKRLEHW
jgi:hypothetical protein